MSKGEDKRQVIFDKFKDNLNLLVDSGFIQHDKDIYVCPMCLVPHENINGNIPLTLEDAPPKSLGGTANILTCKSCNNTAGHQIDFHLTERLREIDSANFTPGTETRIRVKIDGEVFQGKITVNEDGTIQMFHSKKNNNPNKLDKAMEEITAGTIVDTEFLRSRVIPERLEYALLKTAYIMTFERFGYSLIFDPCFDVVRQQLMNPDQRIYPDNFWLLPPYPKTMTGVYFVMNVGLECFMVLFNLDTGNTERMFGVLLPLPVYPLSEVVDNLNQKFEDEGSQIMLSLYPLEQDNLHYLDSIDELNAMYSWIHERQKNCQ